MIAQTTAVVRPGGRLGALHCEPPLTLRRVRGEDPATCALCLVGTAAGPLAGDDLTLDLNIEAGAAAHLQATGASIAQGRTGAAARVAFRATLAEGASLIADPGPLVVCEGSRVDVTVAITLAGDAALEWRELVVLGRSGDARPGAATLRWDVTRGGRPLLRQFVDLAKPSAIVTGGHRVLASALLTGPHVAAGTVVASRTAVAQRIDAQSVLVTVLGDSAAEVMRRLDELRPIHQAERA